mmetsp:Transcript_9987/g.11080  ORF Transcript_9987/g.11080 Transcript_9987/m.11080 type:complete len:270 (+) Transcript_9987:1-810(+)
MVVFIGREWILMERMPGKVLSVEWPKMDLNEKKEVVQKLVDFMAFKQQFKFPRIGSFSKETAGTLSVRNIVALEWLPQKEIETGKSVPIHGPFDSFGAYIEAYLERHVPMLESSIAAQIPLLERFREEVIRGSLQSIENKDSIVLVHGDLNASNILVQRSDKGIKLNIVDWEFSIAAPGIVDFARGLEFIRKSDVNDYFRTLALKAAINGINDGSQHNQLREDICLVERLVSRLVSANIWIKDPTERREFKDSLVKKLNCTLARYIPDP